ncbi:hypothetical protein CF326_g2753 [Tilletia indica]|nr:hypothetical protein CF326_g2753 [Tilletia indica]
MTSTANPATGNGVDNAPPQPAGAQEEPSLARQLQHSLQWLYAFTMTRIVEDQLAMMRKRLLNTPRLCAFPAGGYTPVDMLRAVESDLNLRTAAAFGLLAPLLENWGFGMCIARIAQCFDVERILWRADVAEILQSLASADPQHPELDLVSIQKKIVSNLRTLEDSIREATHVHPREIVIDAEPDDDPRCNLLLPFTFPITPSGPAGCRAVPSSSASSPSDTYPRPFYERAPMRPAMPWTDVCNRVCDLKKYGSLSQDPAWDSSTPFGKSNKKRGQERWDFILVDALQKCEKNFDDIEKHLLRSDIGGPTAKMLSLSDPDVLLHILIKLIPTLSPPQTTSPSTEDTSKPSLPPAFSLSTIFSTYISQGPSGYISPERSLFNRLYGPATDFQPALNSAISSNEDIGAFKLASDGLTELLTPTVKEERVPIEKRTALARAAQSSRDLARAHVGLPALGLVVRNEIMRSVRESANSAFSLASSSSQVSGDDDNAMTVKSHLEHALQSWRVLAMELRRQADADRWGAVLRAQANADYRNNPEHNGGTAEGWARCVSNALDISAQEGWEPSFEEGGDGHAKEGTPSSTVLLEKETGLVEGVLVDPSLELNVAAALLKLGRDGDGAGVVQAASRALALLASQRPAAKTVPSTGGGTELPSPLIDDSTGPAEVLDAVAFWLGGGHRTSLALNDYDPGFYGAGYQFASRRIARDIRNAERRERRRARQLAKAGAVRARADDDDEDEYEEDDLDELGRDADEEDGFALYHEEQDDEPAPESWTVRVTAGETEEQARERVRLQREAIRKARLEVRSQLVKLLGVQLGCVAESTSPVTPGLSKILLAPGRTRTRDVWESLMWKGLVRRGKGMVNVLRERSRPVGVSEGKDLAEGEGGVPEGQGKEEEGRGVRKQTVEARNAAPTLTTEEIAKRARKDLEMALALDPASAKVPQAEIEMLDRLLGEMNIAPERKVEGTTATK